MYIFQPDRYLLKAQIKKYSHYISGRILDVGAGGYSRYQSFFKYDEYIKMDINKNDNIDVVGSADDIPLDDTSFDSVIATQVLEHLKDPQKAVLEINRILKTGGHCLITAPQWNELHEEPHDYFRYTGFGLEELFIKNGFTVVVKDQRGGFFTFIAQAKIRYLLDKWKLHQKPIVGRVMSKIFKFYSMVMIWRDKKDKSSANKKHAIGWLFIFKKF